jgi:Domain of unknown function (DUF4388)/DnaJ domain
VSGPPTVVIAANPYEAELCRRALAETGLHVEVAEGGDGLMELLEARKPLAVVIADGLFCADMRELAQSVRTRHPQLPLFVIGDRGGDLPDAPSGNWLGARRIFFRPVDVEGFADAVEKIAVEAELASEVAEQMEAVHEEPAVEEIEIEAEFDPDEEPAPPPASLGRMSLKQVRRPLAEPVVELPVRRAPTEIIGPPQNGNSNTNGNGSLPHELASPPASIVVPPGPAPIPASSSAEGILRADEAMADDMMVGDFVLRETPAPAPSLATEAAGGVAEPARHFDDSKPTRRLDRELSAAERRLFPDSAGRAPIYDDYDDALGDIDLDSLGIDTLPGIGADALDAAEAAPPRERPPEPAPGQRLAVARETPSGLHQLANQRDTGAGEASPPAASGQPVEEEGSLAQRDLAELLATLHATGWTGRCVLQRGDGERAIYFDSGLPVFATSTMVNDRLGDLLYREGKLTKEQHARTRELTIEPGRRTAVLYVELGLLKSSELFPALRHHAEEVIYACFAWDGAFYRLEREQCSPEDKLRLSVHPWALFVEGVRRKYGLEKLVERVGPPETVLAPTTGLQRALGDCELNASERVAAELLDGERSLADIVLALNGLPGVTLTEAGLYALAWGLLAVGAVRPVDPGAEESPDRMGVRAMSTLVAPISPAAERRARERVEAERPADRAIDRERLLAKRTQIGDCDYFAALGVSRQATDHEIRRAYDRLRSDFAPDRFAEPVRAELGEALDEIHVVLEEAYRVLMDSSLRESYRSNLQE